jgi:excisionase family DNA binding protein
MDKQAEPTFLSPRDAAKLLNIPTSRVLNMIQCRALPALKVGSDWRLRKSTVVKWAQQSSET